jgi:uncharacterized Fe-S cluster protein YjdI
MEKKEVIKEYSSNEITVLWKPHKCIHSENCWRGLPSVFQPKHKPWVNMEGASDEKIMSQVEECASGALSYYLLNDQKSKEPMPENGEKMKVKVFESGPLMVHGEVTIIHADGSEEAKKNVALCRCGASGMKPFCDGSHKKVDFKG